MKIVHSLADVAREQAHMIALGQWNEGRERKRSVAVFLLSALISFAFDPVSGLVCRFNISRVMKHWNTGDAVTSCF